MTPARRPSNGTLALSANGGFTYGPNQSFIGTDSFTYKASDGSLDSNLATVTITVTPATNDVVIDFGPGIGIWVRFNNATWNQLHTISPDTMVTGDMDGTGQDEVIIDFGPGIGIWVRLNNSSFFQLHTLSPDTMVTGNVDGT